MLALLPKLPELQVEFSVGFHAKGSIRMGKSREFELLTLGSEDISIRQPKSSTLLVTITVDGLDDESVRHLHNCVECLPLPLTQLSIEFKSLDASGVSNFAEFLKSQTNLHALAFNSKPVLFGTKEGLALALALWSLRSLRILLIDDIESHPEAFSFWEELLVDNDTLLDLKCIAQAGRNRRIDLPPHLAEALVDNTTLTKLEIVGRYDKVPRATDFDIGANVSGLLELPLTVGSKLEKLTLTNINVYEDGTFPPAALIGDPACRLSNLTLLDLHVMSEADLIMCLTALEQNTSIVDFTLDVDVGDCSSFEILVPMLPKFSKNLNQLWVSVAGEEGATAALKANLLEALESNMTLEGLELGPLFSMDNDFAAAAQLSCFENMIRRVASCFGRDPRGKLYIAKFLHLVQTVKSTPFLGVSSLYSALRMLGPTMILGDQSSSGPGKETKKRKTSTKTERRSKNQRKD